MALTKAIVTDCLAGVRAPGGGPDLVSSGALKWVSVCDGYVNLKVHLPGASGPADLDEVADAARTSLEALSEQGHDLRHLRVQFVDEQGAVMHVAGEDRGPGTQNAGAGQGAAQTQVPAQGHRPIGGLGPGGPPATAQDGVGGLPGVGHAIAVGAGKGGVGKSTVAVNLAVGLARRGHAVGLLDGDIYGPSLPTMLGLGALDASVVAGMLQPFAVHGIKAMSLGKLVEPDKALIWRGPMAHGAFTQLVEQTQWGELDYLVIDLPPGTGDVPLTMAQMLRLTGAVVVCTPQRVAQDDAVRAARMFGQLGVDVLGVVENMSYFVGDDGKEYDIFGRGGAEQMAQRLGVPFLGAVPITMALRKRCDEGNPEANFEGGDALAASLEHVVENLEGQVALASMRQGAGGTTLTIR